MRRRTVSILLILVFLCGFAAAEGIADEIRDGDIAGTYRYEGEGFGGDFTITLNADGTYAFYEGMLSSYMGGGRWTLEEDAVCLTEENGFDLHFRFALQGGALVYDAAGSDAFPYVRVSDAEQFVQQDAAEETQRASNGV